jgi:hypothetical protein
MTCGMLYSVLPLGPMNLWSKRLPSARILPSSRQPGGKSFELLADAFSFEGARVGANGPADGACRRQGDAPYINRRVLTVALTHQVTRSKHSIDLKRCLRVCLEQLLWSNFELKSSNTLIVDARFVVLQVAQAISRYCFQLDAVAAIGRAWQIELSSAKCI